MIYKDKNTRNITSKHQERVDDENYTDRRIIRKQLQNITKFRITIPLIHRFWFDSITHDDKLSVMSLKSTSSWDRGKAIKKITFEELMKMYPGDIAKIRELKLNYLSI